MTGEWIVTIITVIGCIVTLGGLIWTQSKFQERQKQKDIALDTKIDTLDLKVDEIKEIIGNGGAGGMRKEIQEMKVQCAGHVADISVRLSAQQHEIDEIKAGG